MQDDLDRLGDALSEDRLDLETGGIGFRTYAVTAIAIEAVRLKRTRKSSPLTNLLRRRVRGRRRCGSHLRGW